MKELGGVEGEELRTFWVKVRLATRVVVAEKVILERVVADVESELKDSTEEDVGSEAIEGPAEEEETVFIVSTNIKRKRSK